MKYTAKEVLQYVDENDVKFVKLTFCDLMGRQKNVSVVSQQLPSILKNGYLFNSSAVAGFTNCAGDLLLFPDPKTLTVLPWRPQTGEVVSLLTNIKRPDGSFYESDALHLLETAKSELSKMGLACEIATECEFYIFKLDSEGNPTSTPIDRAGYFDAAPDDEGENIRRDIILSLEDMGIVPTSSHHENGPGQNEIDFMPTEPYKAARNFLYFKSAVRNVCRLSGMHASFEPTPLIGQTGSGLRILVTLESIGEKASPAVLEAFAQGVVSKSADLIPFLNSTPDSYKLLTEKRAPAREYDNHDRCALIRALPRGDGKCRIEINSADCLSNPFLVFALILEAGLYGIKHKCKAKSETYPVAGDVLPHDFGAALDIAEKSEWLKSVLSDSILDEYVKAKRVTIRKSKL